MTDLERQLLQLTSADFYRKMRFCSALFPDQDGNAHAQKTWYDVFEEFKRRLGVTEGGPDGVFIAKASEFEDKVSCGNYVSGHVKCHLCDGRGEFMEAEGTAACCPQCDGLGYIIRDEKAIIPAGTACYYCDRCDGCGWYEGGKTLRTECEKCKGTGLLELK